MRYFILDGFRGFFLLFMGIIHINIITDVVLGKLNHHYIGWVEDAQGFVFISGLVVGLVYGGIFLRKSSEAARKAVFRRARTIYSHQVGLICIFLLTTVLLASVGDVPAVLLPYYEEPVGFTLASFALVANSMHMGILPMYIWFMLFTPFALYLIFTEKTAVLATICALLWFLAQTGLVELATDALESVLIPEGHTITLGIFFNVFAWQMLFFSGLYFGASLAQGQLDLSFLRQAQYFYAFLVGLVGFVGFAIYDRMVFDFWISSDFTSWALAHTDRKNFSAIYVVNFYLDLFLVTWLLVAGPTCGVRAIERVAVAVQWIFTRPALVFLGQHSLHVFSYHILLVYFIAIVVGDRYLSEVSGSLILVAGTLSLYIPAWIHAKMQSTSRRAQKQAVN